jgi:hypothetical protein
MNDEIHKHEHTKVQFARLLNKYIPWDCRIINTLKIQRIPNKSQVGDYIYWKRKDIFDKIYDAWKSANYVITSPVAQIIRKELYNNAPSEKHIQAVTDSRPATCNSLHHNDCKPTE